jgi:hypothetical protein
MAKPLAGEDVRLRACPRWRTDGGTPKNVRHLRYSLKAFGRDAHDLNRRFARYMQAFHVTPEATAARVN